MYKCTVYDKENKRKILYIDIDSEEEIFRYAQVNKIRIVDYKEKRSIINKKKLKDKDLKIFSSQMSILLESGCEISKILIIMINQSNTKLKKILNQILKSIERGNSITESFESTDIFPKFYTSMIKAGEISGNLDDVMEKLANYYNKENKLKSKIISILIYPIILLITMVVSFLFILIFLIPNFQGIYADNNLSTPLLTKILIFLSIMVRNNLLLIMLLSSAILIPSVKFGRTNKKINKFLNKLKFNLPMIKTYSTLIMVNKFIKALFILISSGVQIVDSIDISSQVVSNDYICEKISRSNESIKKGNSISESLKIVDEFPNLLLSMIAIGEESGKLDNVLNTLSEYYDNELDYKLEIGTKYFETFITLFIGIAVGGVVIAIMIPMFDAIASIQ